ncbi:hypothetical protein FBUS_01487 [Fasciolopsis buskii]|uniref:Uncharacterized protein n=1 Tax=Fasciolopsis buskii TaxID=27845 RepID=A0A8E0RST9_9TREM|nr:hypothetical protein FBUS_01487 [Fasciolopsis buski]
MSRRSKETKNCFIVAFLDALEINFYERINPKRIKDHLISKARRQQVNDDAGPVNLLVCDDHLELNKGLWWPEARSRFLSNSQIRDVFPLELEGKKFVIGVANTCTRQRRILVFKAKTTKECIQIVDLLDDKREFQRISEAETTQSNGRLADSRENISSFHRSPNSVNFAPSPSVADISEYSISREQLRNRLHSIERTASINTSDALPRRYGSKQRSFDSGEDTGPFEATCRRTPSRLCRTPIDPQIDPSERSASAFPGDYTHSNSLIRRTSRLNRIDRGALNAVGPMRGTVLPNYVYPRGLYRSSSIQSLSKPPNGQVTYVNHGGCYDQRDNFIMNDEHGRPIKQNQRQLSININTNPKLNSNSASYFLDNASNSHPEPRMQSTSPTPPLGFEYSNCQLEPTDLVYRNGGNRSYGISRISHIPPQHTGFWQRSVYRTQSESKLSPPSPVNRSPIVIVRETENDMANLANSLRSQKIENQAVRFTQDTLPPIAVKPNTGSLGQIHMSFSQPQHDELTLGGRANTSIKNKSCAQEVIIYPGHRYPVQEGNLITHTGDSSAVADEPSWFSDSSHQVPSTRIQLVRANSSTANAYGSSLRRADSVSSSDISSINPCITNRRYP